MEDIRKTHNLFKREIIEAITDGRDNPSVLDVGCGFGGDLQKWAHAGVRNLSMCDPSAEALEEAKRRAEGLNMRVNFYHGDILGCPKNRTYDIVCYNFSLHYIFASEKLFYDSIREIKKKMKKFGTLAGIIPNSDAIVMRAPMHDALGNFFVLKSSPQGGFGEKLFVNLVETPFY